MLKMAVLALGLGLSMVAHAEVKMSAICRPNIRSQAQADATIPVIQVSAVGEDKIVTLGVIAGETFSLSLLKADTLNPFPDMIQLKARDKSSEMTSQVKAPAEGDYAPIAISIKSLKTGKIVSISCDVEVTN